MLPVLMTIFSQTNSTLLSTWDNLDLYAENLVRQSYLAAWGSLHRTYAQGGSISLAIPQESRIQATVSFQRVSWLAISLLVTVGGILLLVLTRMEKELEVPSSVVAEQIREEKKNVKKILKDLESLDFF